jgi:hypothetical protein
MYINLRNHLLGIASNAHTFCESALAAGQPSPPGAERCVRARRRRGEEGLLGHGLRLNIFVSLDENHA